MATIIRVDGTEEELKDTSLKGMQGAVGGYIQVVEMDDGRCLVMNEEGKLYGLPMNPKATILLRTKTGCFPNDYIAGDAIIVTNQELNGNED